MVRRTLKPGPKSSLYGGNYTIPEIDERRAERLDRSRQILPYHLVRLNERIAKVHRKTGQLA